MQIGFRPMIVNQMKGHNMQSKQPENLVPQKNETTTVENNDTIYTFNGDGTIDIEYSSGMKA